MGIAQLSSQGFNCQSATSTFLTTIYAVITGLKFYQFIFLSVLSVHVCHITYFYCLFYFFVI